ncbi:MAG: hypothetical protein ACPGRX_04920 [Bdellovibrionales bacterium]
MKCLAPFALAATIATPAFAQDTPTTEQPEACIDTPREIIATWASNTFPEYKKDAIEIAEDAFQTYVENNGYNVDLDQSLPLDQKLNGEVWESLYAVMTGAEPNSYLGHKCEGEHVKEAPFWDQWMIILSPEA